MSKLVKPSGSPSLCQPLADWKSGIADVLTELKKVEGNFVIGGRLKDAPCNAVSIEGAGNVSFPLYDDKVASVKKVFELAPYGRKSETIIDTSVRNSWQLCPTDFKLLNPHWELYLQDTVLRLVAKGLGIGTPIKSTLYKLLLYETGSFFMLHRDSEKEDRMFGTLVIQLPSKYEGGQLVVKHGMESETLDFSATDPELGNEFGTFFSAFYCDCEHEVLPVTSGCRMSLVYNLSSSRTDTVPIAPVLYDTKIKLIGLLKNWPAEGIQKIVCVLGHQYTEAGLSFQNLKGCDQTIARLFVAVVKECAVTLHLALFSRFDTGGGYCDQSGHELYDIHEDTFESQYLLNNWLTSDDSKRLFGEFFVDLSSELIPENTFQDAKPDKQEFMERTGNAGATVERWYHRAALVIWRKGNWQMSDPKANVPNKIKLFSFVDFIKKNYPAIAQRVERDLVSCFDFEPETKYSIDRLDRKEDQGESVTLNKDNVLTALSTIVELDNLQILQRFLELYYYADDSSVSLLKEQCTKFGWENLCPQLQVIVGRGEEPAEILLKLMDYEKLDEGEQRNVCHTLFKEILGKRSNLFFWNPIWKRSCDDESITKEKDFFEKMFVACSKGDYDLVEFLKLKPAKYVIQIAAPVLAARYEKTANAACHQLWNKLANFCLSYLISVETSKVEAPSSWRRSTDITCSKPDCSCLKSFLLMDNEKTSLSVARSRRRHIESHLRSLKDLTFETKWNGNRHDIVVQKNNKTFEKKLKDYNHAKALLDVLRPAVLADVSQVDAVENRPAKVAKLDNTETNY